MPKIHDADNLSSQNPPSQLYNERRLKYIEKYNIDPIKLEYRHPEFPRYGCNALSVACVRGCPITVDYILKQNPDIYYTDIYGVNILMMALCGPEIINLPERHRYIK